MNPGGRHCEGSGDEGLNGVLERRPEFPAAGGGVVHVREERVSRVCLAGDPENLEEVRGGRRDRLGVRLVQLVAGRRVQTRVRSLEVQLGAGVHEGLVGSADVSHDVLP